MAYRFIDSRLPLNDLSPAVIQGFNRNMNDQWRQAAEGADHQEYFTLPNNQVDCDVSSSSNSAQQKILVIGYDEVDNKIQEIVQLAGQARVPLNQQFFRVIAVIVIQNTQTVEPYMDNNEDFVYVYDRSVNVIDGKPDLYFGILDIGKSISKQGYWYLPAGQQLAFVSGIINMDSYSEKQIRMIVQYRNTNDKIWRTIVETTFENDNNTFPLDCTPSLYNHDYGIDIRICLQMCANYGNKNSALIALHIMEK